DTAHTGNAIDGITRQAKQIRHLFRRHAQSFPDIGERVFLVRGQVPETVARLHQLHDVLVVADEGDLFRLIAEAPRERADEIIRLVTQAGEFAYTKRTREVPAMLQLCLELRRRQFPAGLVLRPVLVAKGGGEAFIETAGDMSR